MAAGTRDRRCGERRMVLRLLICCMRQYSIDGSVVAAAERCSPTNAPAILCYDCNGVSKAKPLNYLSDVNEHRLNRSRPVAAAIFVADVRNDR